MSLLHRQLRSDAVHIVAQPIHHTAELAGGRFPRRAMARRIAHSFVQLAGDHGAPRTYEGKYPKWLTAQ